MEVGPGWGLLGALTVAVVIWAIILFGAVALAEALTIS